MAYQISKTDKKEEKYTHKNTWNTLLEENENEKEKAKKKNSAPSEKEIYHRTEKGPVTLSKQSPLYKAKTAPPKRLNALWRQQEAINTCKSKINNSKYIFRRT